MSRPTHSLPWLPLAVLVLVGLLLWFWPLKDSSVIPPPKGKTNFQDLPNLPNHAEEPVKPFESIRSDGKRELQAFRLVVKSGVVTLDGSTRIAGDFHRRRGPQPWMPGMWCVRLLDAGGRVLAEETANAPDEVCLVGDPQNLAENGQPRVMQFAGAGEELMLQVRLPPHPDARMLKVYRIGSFRRADWETEPMGELLASISLP